MEIACIKIKFIPLLKETLKNNSKCCLEIVPEVSYIQNLEKLTWRQERNFIQYTVPMTHTIILRKQTIKDKSEDVIKTYHSCVDLLLSPSTTNHNPGSGDISKILSDTIIFNKLPINESKTANTFNLPRENVTFDGIPGSASVDSAIMEIIDSISKQTERELDNDFTKLHTKQFTKRSMRKLSDKSINTDVKSVLSANQGATEWTTKLSKSREFKNKLSLSAICSIDTPELTSSIIDSTSSKAIICKTNKPRMELGSNHSYENKHPYILSRFQWLSGQNSFKSIQFATSHRAPPELRIAHYVHQIENELLPLKLVLDDLLKKCSFLGINKVAYNGKKALNNHFSSCKPRSKSDKHIIETCEQSISNRAVYTIVFNG